MQDRSILYRSTSSITSPLRYPGGKRRLAAYIAQALLLNGFHPSVVIEPFAGGASVGLRLLNDGLVDNFVLIDKDPLIAAFWETAFFDSKWLIQQIETIEITVDRWIEFKNSQPVSRRDRAITCLFLNRTSFSGILANAGPLGGYEQKSNYPIDCRFPRATLVRRIEKVASLSDRIQGVFECSWQEGLNQIHSMQKKGKISRESIFYYFDPPFFEKANKLYTHFFSDAQHEDFRDFVLALEDRWILSYDSAKKFKELYDGCQHMSAQVELLYSTSITPGSKQAEEVILSNLTSLPFETQLWRNSDEWKRID